MNHNPVLPNYAKVTLVIIGLFVFFVVLYIGKEIFIPLIYATMFAITLSPLVDYFVKMKINRVLAITISLILVILVLLTIILLILSQLNEFTNAFPHIIDKFYDTLNNIVLWTSKYVNISTQKIDAYIANTKTKIMDNSLDTIGITINTIIDTMVTIVLIPVYVFMILFYRPMLLDFIRKLFGEKNLKEVNSILKFTKNIIQRYLLALLFEAAIIAILNSIGLFVIGLNYAVVLGIIGALLNIIPYLGGLIAIVLYIIIVLLTKDSLSYVFYVIVLYSIIQLIDNNLIVPKLVGSSVRINALVAIVTVIVGGALWGISGMFLSIPLIAIIKVIFDHIDGLKPWGFLLGDNMPEILSFKMKAKNKK